MRKKITQWITSRLNTVEKLMEDPNYNVVKHGFFIPLYRAFFQNRIKYN